MAMKLEQKQTIAEELQGQLTSSDVVYLTDFTGLTVEAIGALRRQLREAGAEYRVVKNTLTLRALEGTDIPDLTEHLQGPTALVLGGTDRDNLKRFAEASDDITLAFEDAAGNNYHSEGSIEFEAWETEENRCNLILQPADEWTPFLA